LQRTPEAERRGRSEAEGAAAGGWAGFAGPNNSIIAQHAFGRRREAPPERSEGGWSARPLEPVLGGFSPNQNNTKKIVRFIPKLNAECATTAGQIEPPR